MLSGQALSVAGFAREPQPAAIVLEDVARSPRIVGSGDTQPETAVHLR